MFPSNDDHLTTEERFIYRVAAHQVAGLPERRHHFWWFVHNCIAHPLIGFFPMWSWTFRFHDYTSDKINAKR